MIKFIDHGKMGRSRLGWLDSHFHFSFAEYRNPDNIHFGVLRVLNDDLVQPGKGFGPHPHRDMEIVSYVIGGELTHGDSMGNQRTLRRGSAQYMSAGTGVVHSEMNYGEGVLRFLQIWILPDRHGHEPNYGDHVFEFEDRRDKWLSIASGGESAAPIRLRQDANIYASAVSAGREINFEVKGDRQAYLVLIEGAGSLAAASGGFDLKERDAAEIEGESFAFKAAEESHILAIEMARK